MRWTSRVTLLAGLALIAIANAVVFVGVAYNRSEAESTLRLTQRELAPPYGWRGTRENSGLALKLQWRVLQAETAGPQKFDWTYAGSGGAPAWLDKAKLESLGFSAKQLDIKGNGREYIERQLSRSILLVLELDGPAYQASLDRAKSYAERRSADEAKRILEREQIGNSRLFAIDAGLDPELLRAKYPDRSRFAIVRGQVRLRLFNQTYPARILGYVSDIGVAEISVPFMYRDVFEFAHPASYIGQQDSNPPYEVTVMFGKRLEPWIAAASKKQRE